MHLPTHILSGWCIAAPLPFSARQRLFAMIAATIPDLDGVGFFFGEETYWRFHHIVGHNLLAGVIVSGLLTALSTRRRVLAFAVYLGLFHLHLLLDFFGSGPGWRIHYLWPFDERGWKTDLAWPLSSWQNFAAFGLLLVGTIVIARVRRVTPLECLAPRLDAKLVGRAS